MTHLLQFHNPTKYNGHVDVSHLEVGPVPHWINKLYVSTTIRLHFIDGSHA